MPSWVEGGEWNHTCGLCGPAGAEEGEGDRVLRRLALSTSASTASESSPLSSSDEEAEPEIESSRPSESQYFSYV